VKRVALVTGAGVRAGEAIAHDLARAGWRVAAHYRNHRPRGLAAALPADLASPDGPGLLAAAFRRRFGRLDLLVNSAAAFEEASLAEIDAELARRRTSFQPRRKPVASKWLRRYASLVSNASTGAILRSDF